ncbi:MAG: hypothetical protein ICV64_00490 [Thermoleophilia bacterium]|nr:hypothetical protein [Thermoleophilia bacterium]
MGAAGSPYAAFQRAIKTRNVTLALAEARDMPTLNLADALELVVLIAEKRPDLYERAALRWLARYFGERTVTTLAEAQLVVAALAALPGRHGGDAYPLLAAAARRPRH